MSKSISTKPAKQTLRVSGYGQGFWWLMAASVFVLFLLFTLESNRAISGSFRLNRHVVVERIPPEEARVLGITPRNR